MDESSRAGTVATESRGQGRAGYADPPWLQRLWAIQRVPLPPERLHGWSVHVQRFLAFVRNHSPEGTLGLIARVLYGTGMRLMECLRLRVKDVDFGRGLITIRDGKGDKDRAVMLPEALRGALTSHLERVRLLRESDRAAGLPGVWMPDALDRKYPGAG